MSHSGTDSLHPPPLAENGTVLMDDYTRLKSVGGGFYKEVVIHAGIIICLEYITQLEEDAQSGLPMSAQSQVSREPLRRAMKDVVDLSAKRIELGENSVKGHLFLSAAMGQIEASENGTSPERGIIEASRVSARHCLDLLKARTNTVQTPSDGTGEVVDAAAAELGFGAEGNMDFGYDFVMQDGSPNFNFDAPDSWLYSGWEENSMW